MLLRIGTYRLQGNLLLAPMAGATDLPFRNLCRNHGASMATSEMLTSDIRFWESRKSSTRLPQLSETEPRSLQIAGTEAVQMAVAARECVARGAQIIDINMGCPAKKVLKRAAGSALLREPRLVRTILETVVSAVDVPVTLKFRTGWSETTRNAVDIAQLAEDSGIAALSLHGRTRNDAFRGAAEYETIRRVKRHVAIPVIANGDIRSVEDAAFILDYTHADGLMVGRSALGQPWIFEQLQTFLGTGKRPEALDISHRTQVVLDHLKAIHEFHGPAGVRIGRKHIVWYLDRLAHDPARWKHQVLRINCPNEQLVVLEQILAKLAINKG
ncbi:MAG TPA: tRNA dihydrouridine synthase DusB [Thiolinea sp.]|nr:tRNA dihydrouridine synthase DusB [Thiolinea sp.]